MHMHQYDSEFSLLAHAHSQLEVIRPCFFYLTKHIIDLCIDKYNPTDTEMEMMVSDDFVARMSTWDSIYRYPEG